MEATLIRKAPHKAIVKLAGGTTFQLEEWAELLETHPVLWATLCGNLRDELGVLSREESGEFYAGLEIVEKFFFKTLQDRFNKMCVGDEARFTVYTFWGKEHPDVLEKARNLIARYLNQNFDWQKDILFIFKWNDRDEILSRIIYRVPEEVLATKEHLGELEKLHTDKKEERFEKKLYHVKVWEADKDYDLEYEAVEEVHWDSINKVVELKFKGAVFYICAKKVCVWEE